MAHTPKAIFVFIALLLSSSCKKDDATTSDNTNPTSNETRFTDSRDGQTYKTVRIGSQIWMAENLNFITDSSWCYDNNPENCLKYGRLYNWDAAMIACPEGWHLPSSQEWQTLVDHIGGREVAGKKMKSTSGWSNEGNGSNDRAFNAFPAGYLIAGSGFGAGFRGVGDSANWWSSTESDPQESWALSLAYHSDWANLFSSGFKTNGLSCRCIKN